MINDAEEKEGKKDARAVLNWRVVFSARWVLIHLYNSSRGGNDKPKEKKENVVIHQQ